MDGADETGRDLASILQVSEAGAEWIVPSGLSKFGVREKDVQHRFNLTGW
jgi:hypothetical protein